MAVATKASRVCRATNRPVSEFGSRRAHGPWAATYGAKAAIIAGCANTSNILTGVMFDCGSTGTMAHSYVTSFGCSVEGEHEAFNTYIKMFPRNILSNLYGFEPVSYFEAQQGAETAPKVEF